MRTSKFTTEQIFQIMAEAEIPGGTISAVCRKYNISSGMFYKWKAKYKNLSQSEAKRMKVLEEENSLLKRIIAEKEMEAAIMKEIIKKKSF
jgi:putative transposase